MSNQPTVKSIGIRNVVFGKEVTVFEPVNLYGCVIGDHSVVGPFVEIQCNVTIGKECRIQSHAFICDGVTMGDYCFISHGAKFINDKFSTGDRAHGDRSLWKETSIGNHVLIGTNATILPVAISGNTVIGAGSVVTKDITKPGIYAGNPARLIRELTLQERIS